MAAAPAPVKAPPTAPVGAPGSIIVSTLCGNGLSGNVDGKALASQFNSPVRVACDANGAVYIADPQNNRIRRVALGADQELYVHTIGGQAGRGFTDGPSASSQCFMCEGVAVDPSDGSIVFADSANHRIRKITYNPASETWNVTTCAGTGQIGCVDGAANQAKLSYPLAVVVSSKGDIIFIDKNNHKIRKISPNGNVSTLAGNGQPGFADGPGVTAQFKNPLGLAIDSNDNVYVADTENHRIRRISPSGHVQTVAGTGQPGYADGKAITAQFNAPSGIAVNSKDEVFICELYNHRIRKISGDGQTVSTVAGQAQPGYVDGDANTARFNAPRGLACDPADNLIVADTNNNRIRKITFVGNQPAGGAASGASAISAALVSLLQTNSMSDVSLKLTDDAVFQLHSCIIRARAPKLLEKEKEIAALHLQTPTVLLFLEYVYGDRLPPADAPFYILQGIMACAKLCQLSAFVEYLRQRLVQMITKENLIDFTVYTIDYGLSPELIDFCKSAIIRNYNYFSAANIRTPALQKLKPREQFLNFDQVLQMKINQIPPHVLQLEQQVNANKIIIQPPMTLVSDMKRLLEDEASCDFTIVTSSDINMSSVVKCHRAVLLSRWYYFALLMSSGMKEVSEGKLQLPLLGQYSAELEEVANSAIKKLVLYFYTNQISLFNDVYDCLYIASSAQYFALTDNGQGVGDAYDHTALVKHCLRTAAKCVNKTNCLNVLNVAYHLQVNEVVEVAKQFVLSNFLELADNPQLHQLPSPVLSQIYSNLLRKVIAKLQI